MAARLAADCIFPWTLTKTISTAAKVVNTARIPSKIAATVDRYATKLRSLTTEKSPQLATAEGLVIDAKQEAALAEELAESTIMKSSAMEKVKESTKGTIKEGVEKPKPLDYGHSAIQYEQLKNALKTEEFTSIIDVTEHGLQRLIERFKDTEEVITLLTKPDYLKFQSDGAKVFIKQIHDNKFNIVVINEATKKVITALRHASLNKIENLGKNYGWSFK